jgi:hypothetical protein
MAEIKFTSEDFETFTKGEAYKKGRNGSTVRIVLPDGTETALFTVTYNYNMSYELQSIVAERLMEMWNINR